jgi:hypothetical protein
MSMGFENGDRNRQSGASSGASTSSDRPEAEWDSMKDDVSEMMGAAAGRGRDFLHSARGQATDYVGRRKEDMAQSVADVATSLRDTGATFEDRPHIKAFVDSAADGLEQFADSIRDRSFGELYDDVEVIMRRRPATVAAASLAAGFLFARFLKASAEQAREFERRTGSARPRSASRGSRAGAPRSEQG